MINPETTSEQLLFTTVRLETSEGSGTGFFFHLKIDNKIYPVIITNKHVVNYKSKEKVKFHLHEKISDKPEGNIEIEFTTDWLFHPDNNIDLCCCLIQPLMSHIKVSLGKDVFYKNLDIDIIFDNSKLSDLSAIEDVVMVGYPNGLWDQKHNLPLFRKGITASHPGIDFNRDGIGVVDMACFPGSSGSPIFIFNEGAYALKNGNTNIGTRIIFLGVLFEGPRMNSKGELIAEDSIPTSQKILSHTPVMINLGYYIRANEILKLETTIKNYCFL